MGPSPLVAKLHEAVPFIGPSLLAADFGNMEREIRALEAAGAAILHLDVMDGHFVPNLSFGIPVVKAVRRITRLPLDVHLMIAHPERYVKAFHDAGADLLTVHVEAAKDLHHLLGRIRDLGAGAGIAINPPTPIETLAPFVEECDLVLTMSVMPGFGGQEFQPEVLHKVQWLREHAPPRVLLSIDGGVNLDTIGSCAQAGAELFIVGTALLDHDDYRQRLADLTATARAAYVARGRQVVPRI